METRKSLHSSLAARPQRRLFYGSISTFSFFEFGYVALLMNRLAMLVNFGTLKVYGFSTQITDSISHDTLHGAKIATWRVAAKNQINRLLNSNTRARKFSR
jgi:hypothetical protein